MLFHSFLDPDLSMRRSESFHLPEAFDEHTSHPPQVSPLTRIIQDLRRKNVVTAAAASGPQTLLFDTGDPWGSSESVGLGLEDPHSSGPSAFGNVCVCQAKYGSRKRPSWTGMGYARSISFGHSSPPKLLGNQSRRFMRGSVASESSGEDDGVCPECGRNRATGPQEYHESMMNGMRNRNLQVKLSVSRANRLRPPKHADALLQTTPQLRIIRQASTDMQVSGASHSNSLLNLLMPTMQLGSQEASNTSERIKSSHGTTSDYRTSLVRDRVNQQAAAELASLLWILAHEMSLEDYGTVESEVFTSVFSLVHSQDMELRMAGLSALNALIDTPSADDEKKAIKFANTLSNGLRSAQGNYEFLSSVSKALGHMATRTANVDFVESEVSRALEWLRTERSDRRYVF